MTRLPSHPNGMAGPSCSEQRLCDLQFADLMIWGNGDAFLRHVHGHPGPVVPLPSGYEDDVQRIRERLDAEADKREFFVMHDGVPYRVARVQTIDGHGFFLRRARYPVPKLEALGMKPAMVDMLRALGDRHGMILMAGATGSGKTTTIYSLLDDYATRLGDIIIAIEDPPEIPVQGSYGERRQGLWYQIDAKQAGGYEAAMIAAMRYNPRFVFVGEVRAPSVANEAIRAAVNGHLVVATIHGNSIPGAILALQQIAAAATGSTDLARSILADGLLAVLHQELRPLESEPGKRALHAQMLCLGDDHGLRAKIRSGKLEHLSTDIEAQRMKIARGMLPVAR
ncbi:ATPase, T2SS/T4P/T4SS family [Chitinasiproducens palmae]|uniref:Twitching motility protein PilT n=1 Tax=Chitinasiproducens palmae TaxID=1770053 RepID=A0A1H2PJM3_9BURK|nr:ATPase, T2SS/T4P/T4SS family [Chitinasiproducens palmae]SDV46552.1 twitching motility protein PilT [Chitinasiproducens palmae]